MPSFDITTDAELETAVRDRTSYDDTNEELPGAHDSGQMQGIIEDAKRNLYARTGSDKWYNDTAYGQALVALVSIKAKAAVENINIRSYGLGDESLAFENADPEDSVQIQRWGNELEEMLDQADASFETSQNLTLENTSVYIS